MTRHARAARAASADGPAPEAAAGAASPIGPLGVAVVVICLAFLAAALLWPQAAEGLLRLLLVTLAVAVVVDRGLRAVLPARTTEALHSPFDRHAEPWTPPSRPRRLRELAAQLAAADDARAAARRPIVWSIRDTLRDEAQRRLAERHGLSLSDPEHHPRIRALLSDPTWALIGPSAPDPSRPPGASARPRVPLSRLALILDDLERL